MLKNGIFYKFCVLITLLLLILPYSVHSSPSEEKKVVFNFVDVDLATVTKFISDITGKNFIFDERVKGKITIIAPTKLSTKDAFSLFTSVLGLKGFTIVPSGVDAYKIIPAAESKQQGIELLTGRPPVNESYMARLIPLKHITSADAVRFLQPIVSRDGHISAFEPGNLLLVVDSGLNMEKVLLIIENIDMPSLGEEPEIVFLKHSNAEAIASLLNEGVGHAVVRAPGQPQAEKAKAVPEQRLNAVVVFGDKSAREAMKRLIALLDVPSEEAQGGINVCFLENADAEELAKVLQGVVQSAKRPQQPGAAPSPFESVRGITITSDKATNSIIIVASQSDYQSLLKVIKQLDRKNKQVFVEAMIVEASIDKLRDLGVKWRAIGRRKGEPILIGGIGRIDPSAIDIILTGLSGATVGGMGNFMSIPVIQPDGTTKDITVPGFAALFNLSEFKDAVNVLSTPQILTSDNKEAEIVVGENVPFITRRESDPTRTASVFSTIERKDVGITLRITPQISEGDYVKLDIYQEISSVKQESENILISVGPTTTKRSTKTSIIAKDSQTVVIGGLMQEKEEETVNKMPGLGDIPLLGWLFKQKSLSREKTNLIVFLTPHIIKSDDTLFKITDDKNREFAKKANQYPEGEILIQFKRGVTDEEAKALISNKDATVLRHFEKIRVYHIRLGSGRSVQEALGEFLSMPEVEYAEPNYKLRINE